MKQRSFRTLIVAVALMAAAAAGAPAQDKPRGAPEFQKVLATLDARSNFPDTDLSARVRIQTADPEKGNSDEMSAFFRRDSLDAFLIIALEPSTKKGQGMLLVSGNLWQYDPVSRKFNHSSLKDNYGDSTAKNSDFRGSSKAEDYNVIAWKSGTLGVHECWILELEATRDDVTYPFMTVWVSKAGSFLLKSEEFSLTRRLLRTSLFPTYVQVGNGYLATRQIYQDGLVAGKRTEITVTNVSASDLTDDMFTKAYLEKVNK